MATAKKTTTKAATKKAAPARKSTKKAAPKAATKKAAPKATKSTTKTATKTTAKAEEGFRLSLGNVDLSADDVVEFVTDYAYATVGAGDRAVEVARELPQRLETVRKARTEQADLVVLGAQLRNVDGRPFIGHTVEAVLERSDATVVVVAQPRPKDPSTGE